MTGAVLAGGRSSRFGENKALFPVRGVPMVERIIDVLKRYTEELFIVISTRDFFSSDFNGKIIRDEFPGLGPLAGLHAALKASSTEQVLLAACDMPFLNANFVAHLVSLGKDHPMVVPYGPKGPEPLLSIYPKSLLGDIEKRLMTKRLSMMDLIRSHPHKKLLFERLPPEMFPEVSTLNINTKKELEKALSLYDKCFSNKIP